MQLTRQQVFFLSLPLLFIDPLSPYISLIFLNSGNSEGSPSVQFVLRLFTSSGTFCVFVSARALPVCSASDVRGNVLAQDRHPEAHRVTVVPGNSARVKAWA